MPCPTLRLALTVLLVGVALACRREPPVLAPKSVVAKVAGVDLPGAATATALPSSGTATQLAASGTSTDELFPPPPPPPDVPLSLDDAPRVFARMQAELRAVLVQSRISSDTYVRRELLTAPSGGGRTEHLEYRRQMVELTVPALKMRALRSNFGCHVSSVGWLQIYGPCELEQALEMEALAAMFALSQESWKQPPEVEALYTAGATTRLRLVFPELRLRAVVTSGPDGLIITPATMGPDLALLPRPDGIHVRIGTKDAWALRYRPDADEHQWSVPALRVPLTGNDLMAAGRKVEEIVAKYQLTTAGPGSFEVVSAEYLHHPNGNPERLQWRAVYVPVLDASAEWPDAAVVPWSSGPIMFAWDRRPQDLARAAARDSYFEHGCHLLTVAGPSQEGRDSIRVLIRACAP